VVHVYHGIIQSLLSVFSWYEQTCLKNCVYNKKIQVTHGILRSMVYHLKRRHGGLAVFYGALVPGASSLVSSPG